ncbi:hypothetical protein F5882DRAFT_385794 [Hyaloscypha sp. PMI_1271]|nr:hypothetical protein F5882DRAFT_385794 [Hyaloscypha sp. PMI_1271]
MSIVTVYVSPTPVFDLCGEHTNCHTGNWVACMSRGPGVLSQPIYVCSCGTYQAIAWFTNPGEFLDLSGTLPIVPGVQFGLAGSYSKAMAIPFSPVAYPNPTYYQLSAQLTVAPGKAGLSAVFFIIFRIRGFAWIRLVCRGSTILAGARLAIGERGLISTGLLEAKISLLAIINGKDQISITWKFKIHSLHPLKVVFSASASGSGKGA